MNSLKNKIKLSVSKKNLKDTKSNKSNSLENKLSTSLKTGLIIYVKIADYKIAKAPYKLKTTLGSCVAVSIYDKNSRIGSLCHIMLPKKSSISANKLKFANTALPIIIKELINKGLKIENLEAKIFGGAKIYFSKSKSIFPEIGKENVKMVKKILKNFRIPIIGEDILSQEGRTILFDLENGKVYCKRFSGKVIVV